MQTPSIGSESVLRRSWSAPSLGDTRQTSRRYAGDEKEELVKIARAFAAMFPLVTSHSERIQQLETESALYSGRVQLLTDRLIQTAALSEETRAKLDNLVLENKAANAEAKLDRLLELMEGGIQRLSKLTP